MASVSRRTMLTLLGAGLAESTIMPFSALATEVLSDETKAMMARGKLTIAMSATDNPPFYSDTGTGLRGIDVDLAKKIGESLRRPIFFDRHYKGFDEIVDAVASGKADIAISKIGITTERQKIVAFSEPYVQLRHAMAFNRIKFEQRTKKIDYSEAIRKFDGKLGVIELTSFATWAHKRFPLATIVEFASWDKMLEAVVAGDIEAAYRDEFEVRRIFLDQPKLVTSLKILVIVDGHSHISVVTPLGDNPLLLAINEVINALPVLYDAYYLIQHYNELNLGKDIN